MDSHLRASVLGCTSGIQIMEKIIDRVKKLLALAGNNPNEHEAASAMEKAFAILAEHNLTMETVQAKGDKPAASEMRERQRHETNWSEKYYLEIWLAVADLNACFLWTRRPNPKKRATNMTVFGKQSSVIMTTTMANYLCETMRRLSRQAAKDARRSDFAFINSYLYGMGGRLAERINNLRREASAGRAKGSKTGTTLPALADYYKAEYRANCMILYNREPYAPSPIDEEYKVTVEPVKEETEAELAKRLREEAKAQREAEARYQRRRAQEEKFSDYLSQGGGYHRGRRDAENVSLHQQVREGAAPADPNAKKLK